MRKIPNSIECPIDILIINMIEPTTGFFKKLNFTPNGITTLSLIFGVLSVIFLYKGKVWLTVAFMILSYMMDCLDGYYARKYKMVTKFGDFYDHIKDIIVFIAFVFVLVNRNKNKLSKKGWIIVSSIFIFFLLSSCLYFACQEKYYDRTEDIPSLAWTSKIIKDKKTAENYLKVLRFFGMGTFIVTLLVFTVWIELKH